LLPICLFLIPHVNNRENKQHTANRIYDNRVCVLEVSTEKLQIDLNNIILHDNDAARLKIKYQFESLQEVHTRYVKVEGKYEG